jgi:exopolyphosphatase/guanosine-5'-triphosphate,3'-diphosphate pyrophosphatase
VVHDWYARKGQLAMNRPDQFVQRGAVASLLLRLERWDRDAVHHSRFPAAAVHDLTARLLAMTVEEKVALHIPPGRADVVGAGALILDRVLRRTGTDQLMVSDSDILDGIAWSLAAR